MLKRYLLAPGPTPVPPEVLMAMSMPILYHRAPEFAATMEEVRRDLKWLFQTQNDVLILASTGTGAMEGAVTNFLSPGDKALVVRAGKFGERWAEICQSYGVKVENIDVERGWAVEPRDIEVILNRDRSIKAVFIQASETSTGVMHDTAAIAEIVRRYNNAILAVDAITALGVFDIKTDEWGIDVVVSGSQKAFMLPPGLAFISVSERAWNLAKKATLPRYYFNLEAEKKNQAKNQTAYTAAVSLVVGLREVLRMMKEEGLQRIFARHALMAEATRSAMKTLGLELFAKDSPSNACTAVTVPEGIDGQALVKKLREVYGITIAGGQSELKGKIFRIAHLGYVDTFDVITAVAAVEMVLKSMGYPLELGKGVSIAQRMLMKENRFEGTGK